MIRLPPKVHENSPVPHVRALQKAHNELVEALKARDLQNSPTTRIEHLPGGGVTVNTQGGTSTGTTGGGRWL